MQLNRHILVDRLTTTLGSMFSVNGKLFSASINSKDYTGHLRQVNLEIDDLSEGIHEVDATSNREELNPAYNVFSIKDKQYPTIIYHHGNNEQPFNFSRFSKNTFKSIFIDQEGSLDANLIIIRAPYHNNSLKYYVHKLADLSNFMAMLCTSVILIEKIVQRLHTEFGGPVLISGISLGGWVTNLHKAYYDSATAYAPLLAGAALGDLFTSSSYNKMIDSGALRRPEQIEKRLNFEDQYRQTSHHNVYPLLAQYDQYIVYDRQKVCYNNAPINVLDKGHITSALAGDDLRKHIQSVLKKLSARG